MIRSLNNRPDCLPVQSPGHGKGMITTPCGNLFLKSKSMMVHVPTRRLLTGFATLAAVMIISLCSWHRPGNDSQHRMLINESMIPERGHCGNVMCAPTPIPCECPLGDYIKGKKQVPEGQTCRFQARDDGYYGPLGICQGTGKVNELEQRYPHKCGKCKGGWVCDLCNKAPCTRTCENPDLCTRCKGYSQVCKKTGKNKRDCFMCFCEVEPCCNPWSYMFNSPPNAVDISNGGRTAEYHEGSGSCIAIVGKPAQRHEFRYETASVTIRIDRAGESVMIDAFDMQGQCYACSGAREVRCSPKECTNENDTSWYQRHPCPRGTCKKPCPTCGGRSPTWGKAWNGACHNCAGTGNTETDETKPRPCTDKLKCKVCDGTGGGIPALANGSQVTVTLAHEIKQQMLIFTHRGTGKCSRDPSDDKPACEEALRTDDGKCGACDADWVDNVMVRRLEIPKCAPCQGTGVVVVYRYHSRLDREGYVGEDCPRCEGGKYAGPITLGVTLGVGAKVTLV